MVTLRAFPSHQSIVDLAERFPELDIPSVDACLAFLNAAADFYDALETHLGRSGLSMGKFTVLMQLYIHGELTPSQCAERAKVTRATITGLIDGLERDHWIQRIPNPSDRRTFTVHLSESGRSLLEGLLPEHFQRTTGMMAHLMGDEKGALIQLMDKIRAGTVAMADAQWTPEGSIAIAAESNRDHFVSS